MENSLMPFELPLDTDFALAGRLVAPDGRWRVVEHLEKIARGFDDFSIQCRWHLSARRNAVGQSSRCIWLVPDLFDDDDEWILHTLSWCIAQVVVGRRDNALVAEWQKRLYGDALRTRRTRPSTANAEPKPTFTPADLNRLTFLKWRMDHGQVTA